MIHYFIEKKYHTLVKDYVQQNTPYSFSDKVGVGSYGVAYLLTHKETKEKYVLKRMKTKHMNSINLNQKFKQEIMMLREIDIPHVPTVIEIGEIEDVPFYIMNYIEGHTFEQAIFQEGKTFSLAESLFITKKLLKIIITIHQKGIVHRDLRIPNILIHGERLYIIDFGLASYINLNQTIEEIDNPKKAENHYSDLYFIGHFLLYLLYSNYTPTNKKERNWQEELDLPPEIEEYIERLLLIRQGFLNAKEAYNLIPSF